MDEKAMGVHTHRTAKITVRIRIQTTLFVAMLVAVSGCTTIIANAIVERPDDRLGPDKDLARHSIATSLNATASELETPVGRLAYWRVTAAPYDVTIEARNIRRTADGGFYAFFTADWKPSRTRAALQEPVGTILLLHGHSMTKEFMGPWAALFADAGFNVVVPDLPAHGESGGDFITYGVRESIAVDALLAQLQSTSASTPLVVFGISLGATTAIRSAANQPGWDAVVALEPFNNAADIIPNFRAMAPAWARWTMTTASVEKAMRKAESVAGFSFADTETSTLLIDYAVPTLILHGDEDKLVPATQSRALKMAAPDAITLRVIADGGDHLRFPMSLPQRCADVMPWLAKTLALAALENSCKRIRFGKGYPVELFTGYPPQEQATPANP